MSSDDASRSGTDAPTDVEPITAGTESFQPEGGEAQGLETDRRRLGQVTLCVGCCCGRVDRGKTEVPVDALKALWKEEGLHKTVQLTVSGCLGPCDLHNVVLLMTERGQTWLGELKEWPQFEALAEWARNVRESGADAQLPERLVPHRFERWEQAS